jgi:hypothetical protein
MANINKSFNFRNGVQVDNDNFVVNANGLVGIGTSIPTEFLDVYGTAKITGLVTTTSLAVSGVSNFYSDVKVGSAITLSPSTGSVRATAFYGNGSTLSNIVGYSTEAWIVNIARTGISTTLNVGIGTTNAQYSLQVGQNPLTGNGFSVDGSTGNVKTTGIITAGYFSGDGSSLTTLNASNISSGTLSNSRLPSNISVSGIITASTKFSGDLTGNVTGNVTGIASTALSLSGTPNIIVGFATATQFIGNVTGIASTALSLSGSPSITVTNINATNSGIITATKLVSGISSVGVSTISTRLYAESIGVGTNSPTSDIHVRRTSTSTLQLTSDSAEAIVAIGGSTTLTGSNGALRFGNTSGLFPYSNVYSLDILNYGLGNVNFYLEASNVSAAGTGSFYWHRKPNFAQLMTLTYAGNLGIGVTLPTNTIHVSGTSTVTSDSYVGNNLYVKNNLTVYNDLSVNGTFTPSGDISANLSGNVTGNLSGNVYSTSGISTFPSVRVNSRMSIGPENATLYQLEIGSGTSKVVISNSAIGIDTTTIIDGMGIDCIQKVSVFKGVGIGTTSLNRCFVDFADAGTRPGDNAAGRYMLPPKLTTSDRDLLIVRAAGAFIYNTSVNRLEYYNGSGWCGVATVAGA